MIRFWVRIKAGYKIHRVMVERIYADEVKECFRIFGRDRSIVIESNRPFFRNRGLKNRQPTIKLIEGKAYYGQPYEQLLQIIVQYMDSL